MRRLTASLLVLAVLTTPVLAQSRRTPPGARQPTAEELQKQKEAAEIENQYKATIKATPGKSATNNDPWALVRGMDGKSGQR
jgi:hypothetical protein